MLYHGQCDKGHYLQYEDVSKEQGIEFERCYQCDKFLEGDKIGKNVEHCIWKCEQGLCVYYLCRSCLNKRALKAETYKLHQKQAKTVVCQDKNCKGYSQQKGKIEDKEARCDCCNVHCSKYAKYYQCNDGKLMCNGCYDCILS